MTRSVEELRRDSEQSRAQLAATVDRLREQIADTAEDIRYKVSPENIKAEVSGFISHKTHGWMDALKQQAMDNPMQAIAAGTAIAVPALRLARGFPLPLLMIGAGLALSSKTVRDRAAEAAAPGIEKAREVIDEAAERAQSFGDGMRKAMSHAERQAAGMANEAQETAGGMADAASGMASDLRDRAAQAADAVSQQGPVRHGCGFGDGQRADGARSLDCDERGDGCSRDCKQGDPGQRRIDRRPRRGDRCDPCCFPSEHQGRGKRDRQRQRPGQTGRRHRGSIRI